MGWAMKTNVVTVQPKATDRRRKPRITAAPKVRQIYWCDFWEDSCLPEMCKTRPVVVISYKHTLNGHCLVVPISTDPQEGESAKWAHKLSLKPDGQSDSWVVCNHLYTISNARLTPFKGEKIPRLADKLRAGSC